MIRVRNGIRRCHIMQIQNEVFPAVFHFEGYASLSELRVAVLCVIALSYNIKKPELDDMGDVFSVTLRGLMSNRIIALAS